MVEFEEVKVPKLRLDRVRAAPPVSGRRVPFDEHGASSMLTPKITGPPGSVRGKPALSLQQGRQMQRQGAWRAEALAEGSVELAQAMVPQALVLARGG